MVTAQKNATTEMDVTGNGVAVYKAFSKRPRAHGYWQSFGPQAPHTIYPTDPEWKVEALREKKAHVAKGIGQDISAGPYYACIDGQWACVRIQDDHYKPVYNKYNLKLGDFGGEDSSYWNLGVRFRPKMSGIKDEEPAKITTRVQHVLIDPTTKTITFGDSYTHWFNTEELKNIMYTEKLYHYQLSEFMRRQLGLPWNAEHKRADDGKPYPKAKGNLNQLVTATSIALRRGTRQRGPPKQFRSIGPFIQASPSKRKNSGRKNSGNKSAAKKKKKRQRQVKKNLFKGPKSGKTKSQVKPKSIEGDKILCTPENSGIFWEREVVLLRMKADGQDGWDKLFLRDAVKTTLQVYNVNNGPKVVKNVNNSRAQIGLRTRASPNG